MKHFNFKVLAIFIAVILTVIVASLMGCNPQKQLAKKIEAAKVIAFQNPESFADICARLFPVKEEIGRPEVTYTPAKNADHTGEIDSLRNLLNEAAQQAEADTSALGQHYRGLLVKAKKDIDRLAAAYKKCVPDTIRLTVPVYRENTARLSALGAALAQESGEKLKAQQAQNLAEITAKDRRKVNWYLSGAIVLLVAWNFRRLILPRLFK